MTIEEKNIIKELIKELKKTQKQLIELKQNFTFAENNLLKTEEEIEPAQRIGFLIPEHKKTKQKRAK